MFSLNQQNGPLEWHFGERPNRISIYDNNIQCQLQNYFFPSIKFEKKNRARFNRYYNLLLAYSEVFVRVLNVFHKHL